MNLYASCSLVVVHCTVSGRRPKEIASGRSDVNRAYTRLVHLIRAKFSLLVMHSLTNILFVALFSILISNSIDG